MSMRNDDDDDDVEIVDEENSSEDSGNDSANVDEFDDDDDDDFGVDIGILDDQEQSASQRLSGTSRLDENNAIETVEDEDFPFDVFSTEQIAGHMDDSIVEVNSVIQIPSTTARILLNYFKWDKEKLMEAYYSEYQEQMFEKAHVVSPFASKSIVSVSDKPFMNCKSSADCEICCQLWPKSSMSGLECGHMFCNNCWKEYLTTKIMQDGVSQMIECPGNCQIIVDDKKVMSLLDDTKVKLKYQHLITNSFVECNRLMKWCPAPDCMNALRANYIEARLVKCLCGYVFCFGCSEPWHAPVRCHYIKKWIKKCDDDSETANWIAANTKECPRCNATIEKDGGCNHMICKNQSCKWDFCWVCLGPWSPHGSSWYNCNRFTADDAKKARTDQERSRAALQRYLFFCNRYMNHLQSFKLEKKLYSMVKNKMEEIQQHNMSWIEVQFLRKAVDVLCDCRRTLTYTYVFAYYLKKTNESVIFQDNQKDLENATERLSEYLERDMSANCIVDIKQIVQDIYRYCDSRRKVLLAHVKEGYDRNTWEFIDST